MLNFREYLSSTLGLKGIDKKLPTIVVSKK
jgi:hypothetical protein